MGIPKKILYCWYGKGAHTEKQKMCIASWQGLMPDYELILWDESNSPVDHPYLRTVPENEKWANASNFMRLFALEEHGGLYFDTDVQALKSFDPLLDHDALMGFQFDHRTTPKYRPERSVNDAVSAAIPHHPLWQTLLTRLLDTFDGTEKAAHSGPVLTSQALLDHGLTDYASTPIEVAGCTLFPCDYFYPCFYGEPFDLDCITANTFTLHHWDATWVETNAPPAQVTPAEPDLSHAVSARDQKIRMLTAQVSALRSQRDAVLASRSWRITKPLRILSRISKK